MSWARSLADERLFALEDCRHVSLGLERFLLERGERVVRVPPKPMGQSRKGVRSPGKSDAIDALAIARAAVRERELPAAVLSGPEREIKLLLDHREDLVGERTRVHNRLRWHLHDLDPELEIPAGGLDRLCWLERIERVLAAREPSAQVRIAQELVKRSRELTERANELERELEQLMRAHAAPLLALEGCGTLTAAKVIAEVAGIERFASDARLAKHSGTAPLAASSGQQQRHRLNRHGNRQLNCALHRMAVNQGRWSERARAYLARQETAGKSRREALRCLKRHLARTVFVTLKRMEQRRLEATNTPTPEQALT